MSGRADDFDLPAVEDDIVSTGAAADSSDDERFAGLPRILRYALLVTDNKAGLIEQRLLADIDALCPRQPESAAWSMHFGIETGLALAAALDRRAVTEDLPVLRTLADCVRLLCLPTPVDVTYFAEHRRVAKSLQQAFRKLAHDDDQLCSDIEQFVFGWAALPACSDLVPRHQPAAANAAILGRWMVEHRMEAVRRSIEEEELRKREDDEQAASGTSPPSSEPPSETVPEHHLVVARLGKDVMKNGRLKELLGPLQNVINVALPLVKAPPLQAVRNELLFEFPYAVEAIDFALGDLVGRTTVHLRPLLLVGDPGGGKSRFARRLGEILLGSSGVWRTDASRSDGATFAGTDRRWHSAEPCHPFLAIAQSRIANPLVLIDEIEKAATRNDYSRLWDCLLGFLERETSVRYPDPALQTGLDLSEVSYVATANSLDPLPGALRDRFRVVAFPKPGADDLDALLPAVMVDLASERGLHRGWVFPLDGNEHEAVARRWRGGSVRRLRRIVEAILQHRDVSAPRN